MYEQSWSTFLLYQSRASCKRVKYPMVAQVRLRTFLAVDRLLTSKELTHTYVGGGGLSFNMLRFKFNPSA